MMPGIIGIVIDEGAMKFPDGNFTYESHGRKDSCSKFLDITCISTRNTMSMLVKNSQRFNITNNTIFMSQIIL